MSDIHNQREIENLQAENERLRRAMAEAIKYAREASVEPGLTTNEHMLAWRIANKMRDALEGK